MSSVLQHVTVQDALVVQAVCGLLAHLIFKRYEPERPLYVALLVLAAPLVLSLLLVTHLPLISSLVVSFVTYNATLLTSILFYRVGPFHPLARYPGPLLCKVSMIYMAIHTYHGKRHEYIRQLFELYGDVVRTGPNEICIRDPAAIDPLMGPTGLPKGPMWIGRSMDPPSLPLIAQQDTTEHHRRRRPWNRAFNTASLKGYEPVVAARVSQLVEHLKGIKGVTKLTHWLDLYVFDFMSDMAFGGGSETMRGDEDNDKFRYLMDSSMQATVILEVLPWLRKVVHLLPGSARELVMFRKMCFQRATHRVQSGSVTKDLFHYLNNEDGAEEVSPPLMRVVSDAALAVVAGSDTTAAILSITFFFLLRNPDVYAKLKEEVDHYYPPGEDACDTQHYPKMQWLDAALNETLRLYPADLSGSQRMPTPGSGGKLIGPYFVPEGTAVRVHTFSLHRDPRNFSPHTDDFWPERWIIGGSDEKSATTPIVHNTAAFIPFSVGPANCAGKNLAMLEMRMLLCCCIQQLEFELAGDLAQDPGKFERQVRDWFILQKGELLVIVRPRVKV
ncbi:hypothetical protein EIP91_001778 [Steccherinum ochraceum]|uniref:Cytochrome P450 67 n=1 Tax=Steccherinum ochraceum TaxID=92696 RepID=A0A4R0RXI8_9APHY|nr:hypothetical protein EIP91_001778 [Steccherinum ochraceum]